MYICAKSLQLCLTLHHPVDCMQPVGLLCSWDSPGKNTVMDCHVFPPPGDLPNPGIKSISLLPPAGEGRFCTSSTTWEVTSPPGDPVSLLHIYSFTKYNIL